MNKGILWVLLIVLAAAGIFALVGIGVYNGLVAAHENIGARWAQVETVLIRRSDLIPPLVESAKGYMGHEKQIFLQVAEARSKLAGTSALPEKIQAAGALDTALGRLFAIAESYPDLKADRTFVQLMDELAGTENRIAVERMRYNEAVRLYNTRIRVFPGNLFARRFGFQMASEYVSAPEGAQTRPEVKF